MKNGNLNINISDIPAQLGSLVKKVSAYKAFLFFLMVAALYGFIVWRINVFSNAPAATTSEQGVQAAAQAHVDAATVKKIQSLEDNSVSVQALFDEARQDPFQE